MKDYCVKHLAYADAIDIDGTIWVSNWRFNGLFSIKDDVVNYEGRFIGYPDNFVGCHSYVRRYGDVIYFFPLKNSVVDFYNIKNRTFHKTVIREWDKYTFKSAAGVVEKDNGFWIFPRYANMPVVHMNYNGEIDEKYVFKHLRKIGKTTVNDILSTSICNVSNEEVYIPVYSSNKILFLNLNTKEEKVFEFRENINIHTMHFDGENFWISNGKNILLCNKNFEIIEEYENVADDVKGDALNIEIEKILSEDNEVWVIPHWYGRIVKIDKNTHQIRYYDISDSLCKIVNDRIKIWRTFKEARVCEGKLIIYPISLDSQIEISENGINYKKYTVPDNAIPLMDINNEAFLREQSTDDLEFFLKAVIEKD